MLKDDKIIWMRLRKCLKNLMSTKVMIWKRRRLLRWLIKLLLNLDCLKVWVIKNMNCSCSKMIVIKMGKFKKTSYAIIWCQGLSERNNICLYYIFKHKLLWAAVSLKFRKDKNQKIWLNLDSVLIIIQQQRRGYWICHFWII